MASQNDGIPLVPVVEQSVNDQSKEQSQPPAYSGYSQAPRQQAVPSAPPSHHPQVASSQMSNNTVVIAGQPSQLPPVTVTQPTVKPNQHILVLSLVVIGVCSFCNIASLYCLIPAVIFAVLGFNYAHSNDPSRRQTGRGLNGVSLFCSITGLVSAVVGILCIILYFSIAYGRLNARSSCLQYCYNYYCGGYSGSCYNNCAYSCYN